MIVPNQLRKLIKETLDEMAAQTGLPVNSADAVELLMLTAAQESHLGSYITQINGPAQGIFQMEPATEEDIYDNFLAYQPSLEGFVNRASLWQGFHPSVGELIWNLKYAIIMCRVHYWRVKAPLPNLISGYAQYWKDYYNTSLGRGTVDEAIANYQRLVLGRNL